MPRPKVNSEEIANRLLDEAEVLLKENRGQRLVLSDVANRVGMSQSYAHRFFPTKAHLVRALAKRWFEEVERQSRDVLKSELPAYERLKTWVLAMLNVKRDRYDEDPALFNAYLDLAKDHMDVVHIHVNNLRGDLEQILVETVPQERIEQAVQLTEDATVLFRTPHNIAQYRQSATDERAIAVVEMLISRLQSDFT